MKTWMNVYAAGLFLCGVGGTLIVVGMSPTYDVPALLAVGMWVWGCGVFTLIHARLLAVGLMLKNSGARVFVGPDPNARKETRR